MFNFLKKLFGSAQEYGMGSLPNPGDSRNISIGDVQSPVGIPSIYSTDLSPFGVNDQGSRSSCVGESISKIAEYFVFKRTGNIVKFDANRLYEQCKKEDGIPDQLGTYPVVAARIIIRDGIDRYDTDSNDKVAVGYVFVPVDFEAICQAIYQNGAITIGLLIDRNWFKGKIGKVLKWLGGHQTTLHGYDFDKRKLFGLNSWGVKWIGQIAGMIDQGIKPGHYVARYDDIESSVINIMAIIMIPKSILDEVKAMNYKFTTTMRLGSYGFEVRKLQEKLNISIDGSFGKGTEARVKEFQLASGLVADGIVGPGTRAKLNVNTKSFVPQLAKAIQEHEGYLTPKQYPPNGSRSYRNHSPGNFKPGKLTDYMKKLGATGIDNQGFAIFKSYDDGFNALCQFLTDACSSKLNAYKGEMTISDFFHKYAPSSENNTQAYINQVCKKLGVAASLKIKELL